MEKVTVVLITLVIYKILLIGVGVWAARRNHDNTDYFLGGRGLGPVVAAISYSASSSSAWTLLGMSGAAYLMGISVLWIVAGAVLGMLVAWVFVAPRLMRFSREHNHITLTDFLAHDAQGSVRKAIVIAASIVILVSFAFYVAAQFQGAGNTFSTTFDLSMTHSIIIGGVIIMIYTFLGGFWAVSVTDTIQGFLMAFTAIALPIAALWEVGGISGFISGLQAVSSAEQLSLTGANAGLVAAGFVVGSLSIGLGTFGQPHLLVRFMALRDERALKQARMLTITWFFLVFGGMSFVGLVGHILLPDLGKGEAESIFFLLTDHLFPTLIGAVLLAAVLSAIMSTADSQLLVGASAIAHDLGLGRRFPHHSLWISRFAIAFLVVASILVALYVPATIFKRALFAWSGLGSAFGPVLLMRLAGYRLPPKAVFAAILIGFTMAVTFYLLPNAPGDILERLAPFITGLIILRLFSGARHRRACKANSSSSNADAYALR